MEESALSHEAQTHNNPLLEVLMKSSDHLFLHSEIERVLKKSGEDCLNDPDGLGLLPLYYVASKADSELFQFLRKKGARVDELSIYQNYANECSLLHCALSDKNSALVKFLVENGVPINLADSQGITPLHLAIKLEGQDGNNAFPLSGYLLDKGCIINPAETLNDLINTLPHEEARIKIRGLLSIRKARDEENTKEKNRDDTSFLINPMHSGSIINSCINSSNSSVRIADNPKTTINPLHQTSLQSSPALNSGMGNNA